MSNNQFQAFNLQPPVMQAIADLEYNTPTPIQARAIPVLMQGRDVLGQAQTGTGKTAAFALPMLHTLNPQVQGVQGLVVAPTRELANQVARAVEAYGQHLGVRVLAVYGGQSYRTQISQLKRGVDIVVGTPGRMLDLIRKKVLDLSQVRYLVLDEADEMLSMGFIEDIETILSETPVIRQTALFSATLPQQVRRLASQYMNRPETITVSAGQRTVEQTEQRYYLVNESDKLAALIRLLEVEDVSGVLVFARTKVRTAELAERLIARGIQADALHGDMSQPARETVMGRFRRGQLAVLVATDVAARGLDIDDISHVINYDVPFDAESYVHRIGRTGRAGRSGVAITLLTPRDRRWLRTIEAYTKQTIDRAELPSTEDVAAHREAEFVKSLRRELELLDEEMVAMVQRLRSTGYTPEEIAAAAIQMARSGEEERPIEEIGEVQMRSAKSGQRKRSSRQRSKSRSRGQHQEAGMVRLSLDVGHAQGVRPGNVVGAIAGEAGIPGSAIGAIDIQNERTLVDVAEKHVERVLHKAQRAYVKGHAVTIVRAG